MAGKEFREVRKRLGNEPADSSPYVGYARALLGELKEDMAHNGLQQGVRRRSIGEVKIEVSSVFGQDEIKIIVPTGEEKEDHQEEPKTDPVPYLWIGVRKNWEKSGLDNWMEYGLVVSEPGQNGILAGYWTSWGDLAATWTNIDALDPAAQDTEWETDYRFTHVPQERRYYVATERIGDAFSLKALASIKYTRSNLRMYEWEEYANNDPEGEGAVIRVLQPHDPLAKQEEVDARVFPEWMSDQDKLPWDSVVVLDPLQGMYEPTDRRPGDLEVAKLISTATGAGYTGRVLAGEYAIKIVGFGTDCPDSASTEYSYGFDDDLVSVHDPLVLDLEVRVNKFPHTITKRYEVTLINATSFYRNLWPLGDPAQAGIGCPDTLYGDINHHHTCWWQDCVLADVNGGSIRLAENHAPDYFESNDGGRGLLGCGRKKWDVIIALGWGRVSDARSVLGNVADQIWYLYELALNGGLGAISLPYCTREDIFNAINGRINDLGVYIYSTYDRTVRQVPAEGMPQLNTTDTGITGLEFENYYRIQTLLAGRGCGMVLYGWGGPFYRGWITGDPSHDACIPSDYGTTWG